jgi:hypothetical protein
VARLDTFGGLRAGLTGSGRDPGIASGCSFAFLGLIPSKSISSHFIAIFFRFPCFPVLLRLDLGGLFLLLGNGRPTAWAEAGMCVCVLGLFDEAFLFSFFSGRVDSDLVQDVLCWSSDYLS